MEVFKTLYRSIGYEDCSSGDPENGYDKVAIFATVDGVPTHASVYRNGKWRSKLGSLWDISHELNGLDGKRYGTPVAFLRRLAQ
ncbi:MAG: hypothetical protein HYV27_08365 [Candidatus Hydrogenedentes bacterium]|nr:hypothetical protein [Candidatus Hydrogenedentota bacterium]